MFPGGKKCIHTRKMAKFLENEGTFFFFFKGCGIFCNAQLKNSYKIENISLLLKTNRCNIKEFIIFKKKMQDTMKLTVNAVVVFN